MLEMSNGDYALVALSMVTPGKQPEDLKAIEQRLVSTNSQRTYKDFLQGLKEGADISKTALQTAEK